MNNPTITLDLTESGLGNVVICERLNFQGTQTGPIAGDTPILVAVNGLHIVATLDQLTDLAQVVSNGITKLPEARERSHDYWEAHRARQAAQTQASA